MRAGGTLRNLRLYGELAGIARMAEIAGARPPGFGLADLGGEWRSFWYSFWGLFGAFNVLAPRWFYLLTGGLALAAGAGLALRLVRLARARRLPANWQSHTLLALFIVLTAIGVARWTLLTPASQGRLMFGAVAAIALYLALGWLTWFPPRWQRWAWSGAAAALAARGRRAGADSHRAPLPALRAHRRAASGRHGAGGHLRRGRHPAGLPAGPGHAAARASRWT